MNPIAIITDDPSTSHPIEIYKSLPFTSQFRCNITSHLAIMYYYFLFFCIILCFTTLLASETSNGFTTNLIHRDSLHNPSSQSKWDKLSNTLKRSTSRAHLYNTITTQSNTVQSSVLAAGGEYLMNISIGTPPFPMLGIADTGSDLIWTQCKPCLHCYNQKSPIFNPQNSSSHKTLPCKSTTCNTIGLSTCSNGSCSYHYSYGDESHTNGNLITETVSFAGPTSSFENIIIGCGHDNGGTFNENGSGLIGLGGGPLSLVSQLIKSVGPNFAYCLVPYTNIDSTSKLSFGANAIVSNSPRVVSTPIVKKFPSTFYYLTLEGISIGDRVLNHKMTRGDYGEEKGNIVIDSGTTLTMLPKVMYYELEAALEEAIQGERVEESEGILSLCYRSNGDLEVPIVRVKFEGGELELKGYNTFIRVQEDVMCLAMSPASDFAIFGNLAQMGFLVSYDLEVGKVSFEPMDCTKH